MVAGNQVGQQLTICSKRFGGVNRPGNRVLHPAGCLHVPIQTTGGRDVPLERRLVLAEIVPGTGQFTPCACIDHRSKFRGKLAD
ncbi:MAG: hypothetical protein H6941_15320 [Candidatus Accumulibacter sp.]|nr:hypothetical protein [Accumulibacter sp.]MCB1932523.1 hypothetical protein [Accumulibacter sp.]MCP5229960.1 hypothetical protein [Accumulibacter sp.]